MKAFASADFLFKSLIAVLAVLWLIAMPGDRPRPAMPDSGHAHKAGAPS